jgi:hypothetical protein
MVTSAGWDALADWCVADERKPDCLDENGIRGTRGGYEEGVVNSAGLRNSGMAQRRLDSAGVCMGEWKAMVYVVWRFFPACISGEQAFRSRDDIMLVGQLIAGYQVG